MKSSDDLSALADFGRKWIEDKKENDYKGAKYFWDKKKAKEFSEVKIEDLLFDEYFLNADWLWSGLVDEIKEFWHEYKYGDKTIFCVIGGYGCLPGYAPVKTEKGYTTIGDISIGDKVLGVSDSGETTKECTVINKMNKGKKEVFRVYTNNGLWVDGTKEHKFPIVYRNNGKDFHEIWTIEDIINNINNDRYEHIFFKRVDYITYKNHSKLKIDPWVLGMMLGDGTIGKSNLCLTFGDDDIAIRKEFNKRIKKYGCHLIKHKQDFVYEVTSVENHRKNRLFRFFKEYGISSKNKFIPEEYFKASKKDRLELLAGLLDSDGYLHKSTKTTYEFVQKRKNLSEGFVRLISELGGRATISKKIVNGDTYYRIYAKPNFIIPCVAKRKQMPYLPKKNPKRYHPISYESLGYMPTFDITIDSKSHNFLSFNDFQISNSGKTSCFGSILTWLAWYDFTCKFDPESDIASPQEYYGLKPTSTVAFIALSKTVKKSKEITFSEIKPSFNTQFNKDYFPVNDRVKSQVQIPNNNTLIFPNTATEAAMAGYSVFGYVMDEVSFLEEVEESSRAKGSAGDVYDQAAKSFESAEGRRYSRFKDDGIGILLSSVNYDEDFLVSMVRDVYLRPEEHKDKFHKILLPWKSRPSKYSMSNGYFYFDTEDYKIVEDPYKIAALERYYEEPELESLIFEDKEFHENYEYIEKAERGYYDFDEDELEKARNFKSAK